MISRLRSRVVLEQRMITPDTGGGGTEIWQPLATVWAEVLPLAQGERNEAEQTRVRTAYDITIRYRNDVTSDLRVLYQNTPLAIRSVIDAENRQRWLHLHCEEDGGD